MPRLPAQTAAALGAVALVVLATAPAEARGPSLRITSSPGLYTKRTAVTFRFTSAARQARFSCRLRTKAHRGRFRPCRSPRRYRRLRNRTFVFSVFARDTKGGRLRTRNRRFAVDTVPPTVRITAGPPMSSSSSSARFRFRGSDRSPLRFRCRLGSGAWRRCSSPVAYSGIADGDRRFDVQATDAAGNRSEVIRYGWNVYTGPPRPTFSTGPGLSPGFDWDTRDYVVRCTGDPVSVSVSSPPGWQASVGGGPPFRPGSFTSSRALSAGKRFVVVFHKDGAQTDERFHVRCLPSDFPEYHFTRTRNGGPDFFIIQLTGNYVGIFDRHGVPVWWHKASGAPDNGQLQPDGTISWDPVPQAAAQSGDYHVHNLLGQELRVVKAAGGLPTDVHELLLLPDGNYLVGAMTHTAHVDTSAYGGSPDATVVGAEIQELTPAGALVWKWDSEGHIGLDETGRWWSQITGPELSYDLVHWNAAEPTGDSMLLSFRHLDAIYRIDKASGDVVWKLGGTHTPRSLDVVGDPNGSYPLGGQHDARVLADGTVSILDNNTSLGRPPRVVRYQIDPVAHTATLVQSFSEAEVPSSICCGSARRLSDSWLVDWGGVLPGFVGGYDLGGTRLFKLETPTGFTYRANPVAPGALSAEALRLAMDAKNP